MIDKLSEKKFSKIKTSKKDHKNQKIKDYIFSNKNRNLYFNPKNPPKKHGIDAFDKSSTSFYGY